MLQNEIARKCAEDILKNDKKSRVRNVMWILQLFIGQVSTREEYQALASVRDFPNYIWGKEAVDRIVRGLLTKASVRNQIIDFYKNGGYSKLREELIKTSYETDIPIWLVVHNKALEKNKVYPLICSIDNHYNCIVLVINEI